MTEDAMFSDITTSPVATEIRCPTCQLRFYNKSDVKKHIRRLVLRARLNKIPVDESHLVAANSCLMHNFVPAQQTLEFVNPILKTGHHIREDDPGYADALSKIRRLIVDESDHAELLLKWNPLVLAENPTWLFVPDELGWGLVPDTKPSVTCSVTCGELPFKSQDYSAMLEQFERDEKAKVERTVSTIKQYVMEEDCSDKPI